MVSQNELGFPYAAHSSSSTSSSEACLGVLVEVATGVHPAAVGPLHELAAAVVGRFDDRDMRIEQGDVGRQLEHPLHERERVVEVVQDPRGEDRVEAAELVGVDRVDVAPEEPGAVGGELVAQELGAAQVELARLDADGLGSEQRERDRVATLQRPEVEDPPCPRSAPRARPRAPACAAR